MRKADNIKRGIIQALLILISFVFILPFLWMFISSFKPALEIIRIPQTILPEKFTLNNFKTIFERLNFWRFLINSVVVSVAITAIAIFTSSLSGFVFTKFQFKGKEVIFTLFLAGLMIPFAIIVLPMYLFVSKLGMQDSYLGLVIPMCISPFGIFLMRQFMEGVPIEMVEAGRIDGAKNLWIYAHVMVPLSRSGMGAVGVFTFLWIWNQLWWPLMIISKSSMRTLPLAIAALTFQQAKRYDMIVTGASLAVLPVMLVFIFAQRGIVRGVTLTGLKS
ncbi:MAG: carbohydrate ABC transporter permease [Spirochaetales bacterium]|nr:MAG: carbohydrate ABC transporter permease [Spirochaetales bacterium]